ncbi:MULTISPECIES: mechanosensitive ion channel domain-containing protein [unclassified Mucilaginibacter]|uniref:mechanosensitive ion channel family protein n=1 Tax=unclassified Mucilaginibacter TaxID=2617802 RepID=UPI002AC953D1|nr:MULTISPECIES: mechanosensitive ion channel domain-containing protein [unclassified Mucilaginibacter]MEB0261402.1 mechanosensitive ion channel [Mucilaginibacter sp. 10I4]MEB0278839.1 mechanosensitive ion channel [Mucilaginibacter sp. 10B2]MEB0299795.1 mechanosensitive ion channel [Mucilaginibacter sp. 5C4]WPX22022.1 mechanosensitive ion channel [Mucilaginibacter sp. 5C4]
MNKVFKISSVLLLLFTLFMANASAQGHRKPQTVRDSLRRAILRRDSMMRTFKKSDTSINNLLQKVEYYTASFNSIKTSLSRNIDTVEVSQKLPAFEKRIGLIKNLIDDDQSSTLRYLYAIRDILTRSDDQLDLWQDKLADINTKLVQNQNELASMDKDSTLKIVPADSSLLTSFLIQKIAIESKHKRLDTTNKKLLLKVGLLQNRISSVYISLLDLKDQIDIKIREFSIQALSDENNSIWELDRNTQSTFKTALTKTVSMNTKLLTFFLARDPLIHLSGFLILILFFVWIYNNRRKVLKIKESPQGVFSQAKYVALYPIASAIVIAFAIVPNFYDHPPVVVLELFFVVLISAVLYLVKKTCPQELFKYLRIMYCLVIVYSFSNLFVEVSNTDRVIVLILSAITAVVSYYFLQKVSKAPEDFLPHTKSIVKVFIGLQVISFLFNVFGRVTLAKIVGVTSIYNLWLALGMYYLVRIIMQSLFLQLEANKNSNGLSSFIDFKMLQNKFRSILTIMASVLWLIMLFQNLSVEDAVFNWLGKFLTDSRSIGGTNTSFTFQSIIIFIAVIWLSSVAARIISYLYEVAGKHANDMDVLKKKNRTSTLLIKLGVFAVGFLLAITASGFPLDKITIIISAFGIGIGFGLQNIVNNLVSGLILAFEKPIQIGDIIEVDNRSGTIMEIGIRSSKIATSDGAEVIIPNGDLISHHVINWTLSNNNRRIELIIGVAYGSDIERVKGILTDLLCNREEIMDNPAPLIFVHNLTENSVDFRLLFWAADISTWLSLKSHVLTDIYATFDKEGIKIPFPQRDLHLRLTTGQEELFKKKKKKAVTEEPTEPLADTADTDLPDAGTGLIAPDQ